MTEKKKIRCSCGASLADVAGTTPAHLGATPACFAAYNEVMKREYGEFRHPPVHRLTVDAYAVQHPGKPGPPSIQSVGVHLLSLCLILERGVKPDDATREIATLMQTPPRFKWLEPPKSPGEVTLLDVAGAKDLAEHSARVDRWARSVWAAWSAHHETVRSWVGPEKTAAAEKSTPTT